jgi:hypothetical protein
LERRSLRNNRTGSEEMAKRKLLDLLNGRPPGPKVLRIAKPSRRERIVKLFTGSEPAARRRAGRASAVMFEAHLAGL